MKCNKALLLTLFALGGSVAFGGTAKFTGQGHVSKSAEYVELNVSVASQCHDDLSSAREGANAAAQKVLALFRSIIDPTNPKEAAYTRGGSTTVSSGYRVNGSIICANTYEKKIRITLLTTDLAGFQENFLSIEDVIYSELGGSSPIQEGGVTYATLSVPVAHLFSESVDKIERQALKSALNNAKDKFGILAEAGCGVSQYSITNAEEPPPSQSLPNPYAGTRGVPPSTNPTGAPVIFADIWLTKALNVTFEFTGGNCD